MFPAAAGLVVIIVSIVFRAFNLVDGWWIVDSLIVYFLTYGYSLLAIACFIVSQILS